jgi:type I restriction enzyme S subunit
LHWLFFRIAGVLGSLDEKIALNRKKIAELEALAKTIYDYWFVQFDFPDKNGKPYKSSGGKMVWNDQLKREVPGGWEVGVVGDYVEIHRGSSPRPIQDFLAPEGLRWLKISDASSSSSPFVFHIEDHIRSEGKSNTVLLTAGNLVLSNSASPGIPKFLGVDSCIHDGWLYFPQSRVSREFLYLFFESSRSSLVPQENGSVFKNLKTDILKMFPMIKPNDELLRKFDSVATTLFNDIRTIVEENIVLVEQRDTLLPLLMNGQVKVAG